MTSTTWSSEEHERGFLGVLDRAYRPRFEQKLGTKGRREVLDRLHHLNPFPASLLIHETGHRDQVIDALVARGAPATCYVLSSDTTYDKQYRDLAEVLDDVLTNSQAYVLSCIPGRLWFFQSEGLGARWIVDAGAVATGASRARR